MKNEMVSNIMKSIAGTLRKLGTKDGYEEVGEDFEAIGLNGEDRVDWVERYVEDRSDQLERSMAWLSTSHRMDVSNFSSTLKPEDLIDWIDELEDYFELDNIGDPLRMRLA